MGRLRRVMLPEGALTQRQTERSELRGEAPQAYACGGGAEASGKPERSEVERGGSPGCCPVRGR